AVSGMGGQPWHLNWRPALAGLLFVWLGCCASAAGADASGNFSAVFLRWVAAPKETNRLTLEVTGLSKDALAVLQSTNWPATNWPRLLAVFVEQPGVEPVPMLGAHRVEGARLCFVPAFPLEPGLRYRAVFDAGQLPGAPSPAAGKLTSALQIPVQPERATTSVTQVYPSADVLPENLLKFYVHFSAPMSRGNIYEHIRLLNEANQPVELPFLELAEELWTPDMMRLTLFIDPGRIKREVKPLEEIGPALVAGRRFTRVIGSGWKDANGNRLQRAFTKRFTVGPPDRDAPDPRHWGYKAPPIRTREPLAVDLAKPMDSALALRMIHVVDESGHEIPGQPFLTERERIWKFLPLHSWRAGRYSLIVETTIEDLAGNNIGKPFEVDVFDGVAKRLEQPTVKLPFELR
ncbi:MAG: hypothetical protein ACKODH_12120, partial [Limisphaerales bacterium]